MKFLLACALMLLSGCHLFVKEVPVPSDPVLIEPDKQYRTACDGSPPPDPAVYDRADAAYKEALWSAAYIRQTAKLALCNQKIDKINEDIDNKRNALLIKK